MKREPLGAKIDRLLKTGMPSREIAALLGCKLSYVHKVKSRGGYEAVIRYSRERARRIALAAGRRTRSEYIEAERAKAAKINAPVIAAVDSGATYAEAARRFGLTRSAVAGIMNRRPEAAGCAR